jgi:hypothetical protein
MNRLFWPELVVLIGSMNFLFVFGFTPMVHPLRRLIQPLAVPRPLRCSLSRQTLASNLVAFEFAKFLHQQLRHMLNMLHYNLLRSGAFRFMSGVNGPSESQAFRLHLSLTALQRDMLRMVLGFVLSILRCTNAPELFNIGSNVDIRAILISFMYTAIVVIRGMKQQTPFVGLPYMIGFLGFLLDVFVNSNLNPLTMLFHGSGFGKNQLKVQLAILAFKMDSSTFHFLTPVLLHLIRQRTFFLKYKKMIRLWPARLLPSHCVLQLRMFSRSTRIKLLQDDMSQHGTKH